MDISVRQLDFKELNDIVRQSGPELCIRDCYGQRFIGSGAYGKTITIYGTPGNALGAYLDGANIVVNGNAQDAVGDTMNDGSIVIHGNAGDALGYAMRGGKIYVKGNAGYRTGIHMKQYKEKKPIIVVGGRVGSFLGEYLAGGLIVVLGIGSDDAPIGNFTGTGMHGGRIFIRAEEMPAYLPVQVIAEVAAAEDMAQIVPYVEEFAACFDMDAAELLSGRYYMLKANAHNPYKQLYTTN